MQNKLQDYYTATFPDRVAAQVGDLTVISNGWESDVYGFTVEYGPASERRSEALVLRIYPGDDAYHKSEREFRGMRRLYEAGYPVPQVYALERENSPFGRPLVIMERIEGELLWPLLSAAPETQQREWLSRFCRLFVQLHRLDWTPFVEDAARYEREGPYSFVDDWLARMRAYAGRFEVAGFLPALAWLEARRAQVPCQRPAPVHWDFHPNNVLVRPDGALAVIDWTQIQLSDARFDLAWSLLLTGSHAGMAWRDLILQEYERWAGAGVEQLAFFEVAACFKRLASVAISLLYGPEKLGMRPEAVALMKQQLGSIRRVYDLLLERTAIELPEVERLLASSPAQT
jgi:aminoglycoside phosphotransferase (APT) family kinase protein